MTNIWMKMCMAMAMAMTTTRTIMIMMKNITTNSTFIQVCFTLSHAPFRNCNSA